MDMHYYIAPGGLRVCVMVDGDRDEDGNLTAVHAMYVIFRKRYTRDLLLQLHPGAALLDPSGEVGSG